MNQKTPPIDSLKFYPCFGCGKPKLPLIGQGLARRHNVSVSSVINIIYTFNVVLFVLGDREVPGIRHNEKNHRD
jgi:hypothetical protein